jgi:hypothetical protein
VIAAQYPRDERSRSIESPCKFSPR